MNNTRDGMRVFIYAFKGEVKRGRPQEELAATERSVGGER